MGGLTGKGILEGGEAPGLVEASGGGRAPGEQTEQPPSHPQAAVICSPGRRLAALSGLRSMAPLC